MNLEIFKNKSKNTEKSFVKNFIEELSNYVQNKNLKVEMEDGFYQVVDFGNGSVFLKNMATNKVFEEKNIPNDLKEKLFNDCIVKCENGVYTIDKEKTEDFMNNMIDIKDFNETKK